MIYDASNARAKKVSSAGTTYYIGEHFEKFNGDTIKYIFAGNLRIAKVSSATGTYYFHKDHLGSSSAMTDSLGNIVETTNYMPFGEQREHTGTAVSNYKFTDQELDPETGLYYYGARYYDPVIGRFISPDSVIPDPFDPQSLNRYTYCRNNPIIYTDPDGHVFGIDDAIMYALIAAELSMCSSYAQGGSAGQVAMAGAIGFVAGFAGGAVGGAIGSVFGAVVGGAVGGATSAALSGGNIGQGALFGAIGGAVAGGLNAAGVPNNVWGITVKIAAAGITGGIMAELSGAKFSQGALPAMLGAAVSSMVENAVAKSNSEKGVSSGENGKTKAQNDMIVVQNVEVIEDNNQYAATGDYWTDLKSGFSYYATCMGDTLIAPGVTTLVQKVGEGAEFSLAAKAVQHAATTASKTYGTAFLVQPIKSSIFRGFLSWSGKAVPIVSIVNVGGSNIKCLIGEYQHLSQ